MHNDIQLLPYTAVLIRLLKGPLEYVDGAVWEKLLRHRHDLQTFVQPLGLQLVLDEGDGYAYLKHAFGEDEDTGAVWMQRRPFTYEESIMLVLLREMMAEFETGEATTRELVRRRREIKEYAELFFREGASRVKFGKEIDRLIDKTEEYGFLQLTEDHEVPDEQRFRIRKLIKARVSAEALDEFAGQLQRAADGAQQLRTTASEEAALTQLPADSILYIEDDPNHAA